MTMVALVLVVLLVVGLVLVFTKWGRPLFDVAVFLVLVLMLLGVV